MGYVYSKVAYEEAGVALSAAAPLSLPSKTIIQDTEDKAEAHWLKNPTLG